MPLKKLPKPIVAISGRANVGKSTLFNRLTESNKALISSTPGTTRDRNYSPCEWRGKKFTLVDIAGIEEIEKSETLDKDIKEKVLRQAKNTLEDADVILFLVDLKNGQIPIDKEIARSIQRIKKPTILVGNKADNRRLREGINDPQWLSLGMGQPFPVSAINGISTGDLLDEIVKKLPKTKKDKPADMEDLVRIAIIGKPNVGKSSLLNAILGEEEVIVSPIPFTTREPHDVPFTYKDHPYVLIDTVGIRKKAKISFELEKKGVRASILSLREADVALLVTEVNENITSQDKHLADLIRESKIGLIIVANKWDLVEGKDLETFNQYKRYYDGTLPYLSWAPLIYVSAKTGQRVNKILDIAREIMKERKKMIPDEELETFIRAVIKKYPPLQDEGTKYPRIHEFKQSQANPPLFTITIGYKDSIHESYLKLIEKKLREEFGFSGTPIAIRINFFKA